MSRTQALILSAYILGFLLTYGYKLSEERRWYGVNTRDYGAVYVQAFGSGLIWPIYWPFRVADELFKDRQASNPERSGPTADAASKPDAAGSVSTAVVGQTLPEEK